MAEAAGAPRRRTEELNGRHRRYVRWGLAISLVLHAVLFLALRGRRLPPLPQAAAGPRAGGVRAAAGTVDGGLDVVMLRPAQAEPVAPPPEPLPVPEVTFEPVPPPELELTAPDLSAIDDVTIAAMAGTGGAAGQAAGLEDADGRGNAGAAAEGGRNVVPPAPRGLILPPADRPGDVRGKEIAVWVFVTAAGAVVPDSTRLEPPTGNGDFDDKLREQAAEWLFEPARESGKAVAEWFRYVIIL